MGLQCNPNCDHSFCLSSVSVNNFKKGDLIGRGFYGNVYKVKELHTDRVIAVKTFNFGTKPGFLKDAMILQDKLNDFRNSIHHPQLVQYYGAIRKSHKLYIFREYVEGQSIKDIIFQNPRSAQFINESNAKHYAKHVLEALRFLHQLNIIHKNVKIGNIFITTNNDAKLADYGFCEILKILSTERERTCYGSSFYIAPEIHKDEPFDSSVDIWSLGVVINEMLTGRPPLFDFPENFMRQKLVQMKGLHNEISAEWKAIIKLMMKENPSERATAHSLLQSEFFNEKN